MNIKNLDIVICLIATIYFLNSIIVRRYDIEIDIIDGIPFIISSLVTICFILSRIKK